MENLVRMDHFEFYKGKRVLITGHTGFKGGWLTIWLQMLGAEVTGYALDPLYPNGVFTLSAISSTINDIRADIRDLNRLKRIISEVKPEIVFHLAAQPVVLESYLNPVETFDINILGSVNLLEAVRTAEGVRSVVMITSDKCYDNREWVWGYRENDPMGGHDPYSASKAAAELAINSYRESFFSKSLKTGIASARAGNVIGGGDWTKHRLIPDMIRAFEKGVPVVIRNPEATRPWQHVLDPLGGYLMLGMNLFNQPDKIAGAWNFGPSEFDTYPVSEVVKMLVTLYGKGDWAQNSNGERHHEANLLHLDISKARKTLGWRPILSLKESLQLTADWYKVYLSENVRKLSESQIIYYQHKWKSRKEN